MNTLILFATKYGATREIAERVAENIGGAVIHDLKQNELPDLAQFDCVIIGSSLYAGSVRKELKVFLTRNGDELLNKKLGLFLSGMAQSDEKKYFDDNFPSNVLQAAKATSFLGGIFDPQKAGKMERFIMKIVTKQSGYANTINDEKIKQFARYMKQ